MKLHTGTPMQMHFIRTRFEGGGKPGPKPGTCDLGHGHIREIRQLLRTDMTIGEIAARFGVSNSTLRGFIKRRRLCNLRERREFITLQKSVGSEVIA